MKSTREFNYMWKQLTPMINHKNVFTARMMFTIHVAEVVQKGQRHPMKVNEKFECFTIIASVFIAANTFLPSWKCSSSKTIKSFYQEALKPENLKKNFFEPKKLKKNEQFVFLFRIRRIMRQIAFLTVPQVEQFCGVWSRDLSTLLFLNFPFSGFSYLWAKKSITQLS